MKKIIAALDGLNFSVSTRKFSIQLTKQTCAHIVGVLLVPLQPSMADVIMKDAEFPLFIAHNK